MKIAIISSMMIPSPPPEGSYGGLELVTYLLSKGLYDLGEDVTLIAPKGSKSDGFKLIETVEPVGRVHADWLAPEAQAYQSYKPVLKDMDVVIDHSWGKWSYLAKTEDDSIKVMGVLHSQYTWSRPPPVKYPNLVGLSTAHAKYISAKSGCACRVAHNGIRLEDYPFKAEKGSRYLFLNRIMMEKGPQEFVSLMRRLRLPGDVVGEDQFISDPGFATRIRNECDGYALRYFGSVPHELKVRFFQNAKALIALPLEPYIESFGLYVPEANACGTPVFGLRNGGLLDTIKDGVNGFLFDSVEELGQALKDGRADEIKPENCRRHVEENFTVERMARRYQELCKSVISGDEW